MSIFEYTVWANGQRREGVSLYIESEAFWGNLVAHNLKLTWIKLVNQQCQSFTFHFLVW